MTGSARRRLLFVLCWAVLAAVIASLLSGFFLHLGTFGAHDWDMMESNRYVAVKSILDFGQFPFWDPYGCGGFAAWGAPEGAPMVVSPFLPAYLALPLAIAVRIEVATLVFALVVGCWFFARSYVEHPLALAFACLVGALNSRTALQAAAGHTWHLYYAGLPWVLGAFDRSLRAGAHGGRWLAFGAVVFALMIYGGGIYPVPHSALCLVGLGAYRAMATRSARPLVRGVGIIAWGSLLGAPKLLPVLETMQRFPRFTRSLETIDPASWLRMFVGSADDVPGHQVPGLDYMWHEYGQYIGLLPLAIVLWANVRRLPPELRSLRAVGWAMMILALGGWGPWVVLHLVPPFRSQHAPSRFTYPALLLFAVVAASFVELRARAWRTFVPPRLLNAGLWIAFLVSAGLIAREDARCTRPWFSVRVPYVADRTGGFAQYDRVPPEYDYGSKDPRSPDGLNGPAGLLVRRANVGAIRCSESPGLNQAALLGADGRPPLLGARGLGDPLYRGEYWLSGKGSVTLRSWSPGEVVLSVAGAAAGDMLVYNQNFAMGWKANGAPTLDEHNVNAYRLTAPAETVDFRYRPRTWPAAMALFLGGLLVAPGIWASRRLLGVKV